MRSTPVRLTCLAALGALGLTAATADGAPVAPTTVATLTRQSPIAGYGSWLAWSSYEQGRFRLTFWDASTGRTRTPRIASRSLPFDVDLGPDGRGRPTAVYSRCARDPGYDGRATLDTLGYTRADGCDVYRVDVTGGTERRVRAAASKRYSEVLPTIWRDRVVFARVPRGWRGNTAPEIRVARDGERRTAFVPGGSNDSNLGPTRLDSFGTRVVFGWSIAVDRCGGEDSGSGSVPADEVWMARIGAPKGTRIARSCGSRPADVVSRPTIGRRGFVARALLRTDPEGSRPGIYAAPTNAPARLQAVQPNIRAIDVAQLDGATAALASDAPLTSSNRGAFPLRVFPTP